MEYKTISKLIEELETYRKEYGEIPVLIAIEDDEISRCLFDDTNSAVINIVNQNTEENQLCCVISNFSFMEDSNKDDDIV